MLRTPIILALTLLAAAAAAAELPAGAGLQDYLDWADAHHPALAGQHDLAAAMREDAAKAGALPELRLAWGEMVVPVETRVGPQRRVFSLSQSFPWFGTLGRRSAAALAGAAAADENLRARRLAVARDVRAAWYRLGALDEERALILAAGELASATAAAVRAGYAAGTASHAGLLQAEMEEARLAVAAADLADRRVPLAAALAAAAGLPSTAAVPTTALPDSALLDAPLPEPAALAALLQRHNPDLGALAARAEGGRLAAAAAAAAAKPTFTLGLDYIVTDAARMPGVDDSGKDPLIARLGVGLPLWGGAGAERRAAAVRARAAGADLADRRLQLEAKLAQAQYAWRETGRRLDLHRGELLPRARRLVDAAAAAYAADQAGFADLLAARRSLLTLQGDLVRVRLDRALALNDLAALLGVTPAALGDPQLSETTLDLEEQP